MKNILLFTTVFVTQLFLAQVSIEKKIYFDFNASEIQPQNKMVLDSLVVLLSNDSIYSININGYADEKGTRAYNKKLAFLRAKTVKDYFIAKKLKKENIICNGIGSDTTTTMDSLQRNVKLVVHFNERRICGFHKPKIIPMEQGGITNLEPFYTTESMIKNRMFAIDSLGNIVKTAGMISFNYKNPTTASNDEIQMIEIPIKDGETFDKDMKIWVKEPNKKGEMVWVEKEYELQYNANRNCYTLHMPCNRLKVQNQINIDKQIPKDEEVVYFSTYENVPFYDVKIQKTSFSAIVRDENNESVYAFVKDKKYVTNDLVFWGKFKEKGKEKTLRVNLQECDIKQFKGDKHYALTKKSNYFIDKKEYNKQTGFWAWLKRLFS